MSYLQEYYYYWLDKPARLTIVPDCHYLSNQIKKETNSETIIGPPKIFNAMTQVKINRLPGSYSICRWLSILVHFVFIMLYPFIYNDNDAYCLHGWCVFFMYILNGAFVANLNILLLMLIKRLTLTKPIPEAFFNRYHPLFGFSKHDFPDCCLRPLCSGHEIGHLTHLKIYMEKMSWTLGKL